MNEIMHIEHHQHFTATYLYGRLTTIIGGPLEDRRAMSTDELYLRSTVAGTGW